MKTIPVATGFTAFVDDEDYEIISAWKWCARINRGTGPVYAQRTIRVGPRCLDGHLTFSMHRQILGCKPGDIVDHANGNGLDNRRSNIRIASASQNASNRRKSSGTSSQYKGVDWHKASNKWRARIAVEGRTYTLGYSDSQEELAAMYDEAARKLHGEFARTNA